MGYCPRPGAWSDYRSGFRPDSGPLLPIREGRCRLQFSPASACRSPLWSVCRGVVARIRLNLKLGARVGDPLHLGGLQHVTFVQRESVKRGATCKGVSRGCAGCVLGIGRIATSHLPVPPGPGYNHRVVVLCHFAPRAPLRTRFVTGQAPVPPPRCRCVVPCSRWKGKEKILVRVPPSFTRRSELGCRTSLRRCVLDTPKPRTTMYPMRKINDDEAVSDQRFGSMIPRRVMRDR